MTTLSALERLKACLPIRSPEAHKGNFGTVLIIGGAPGMSGAVQLAGEAALRVGAGRVIIATHPSHAAYLNVNRPELMVYGISGATDLLALCEQATHLLVGPGLSRTLWGKSLWEVAISQQKPCVVDADGLYFLAQHPKAYTHLILTPHPGEAARLLSTSVEAVQRDRIKMVQRLQDAYNGVVVLKGHHTLVYDGGQAPFLCEAGNPGMASAGMGDVLAGVIVGLWPQLQTAYGVAMLGVVLHACAGDLAAEEGMRGLIASDLFSYLRQLLG